MNKTSAISKAVWERIWNEHAGWCDIQTRTWLGERRHIRKIVGSYTKSCVNWRYVWRSFDTWFSKGERLWWPNWLKQQRKIQELINEQINS